MSIAPAVVAGKRKGGGKEKHFVSNKKQTRSYESRRTSKRTTAEVCPNCGRPIGGGSGNMRRHLLKCAGPNNYDKMIPCKTQDEESKFARENERDSALVRNLMVQMGLSQSFVSEVCNMSSLFPFNQWIRGKSLHTPAVQKAGRAAMEWYATNKKKCKFVDTDDAAVALLGASDWLPSPGERVEARWAEGRDPNYPGWYDAIVQGLNVTVPKAFAVRYTDGSVDDCVHVRYMRRNMQDGCFVGRRLVDAMYGFGTVKRPGRNGWLVRFDNEAEERSVTSEYVRSRLFSDPSGLDAKWLMVELGASQAGVAKVCGLRGKSELSMWLSDQDTRTPIAAHAGAAVSRWYDRNVEQNYAHLVAPTSWGRTWTTSSPPKKFGLEYDALDTTIRPYDRAFGSNFARHVRKSRMPSLRVSMLPSETDRLPPYDPFNKDGKVIKWRATDFARDRACPYMCGAFLKGSLSMETHMSACSLRAAAGALSAREFEYALDGMCMTCGRSFGSVELLERHLPCDDDLTKYATLAKELRKKSKKVPEVARMKHCPICQRDMSKIRPGRRWRHVVVCEERRAQGLPPRKLRCDIKPTDRGPEPRWTNSTSAQSPQQKTGKKKKKKKRKAPSASDRGGRYTCAICGRTIGGGAANLRRHQRACVSRLWKPRAAGPKRTFKSSVWASRSEYGHTYESLQRFFGRKQLDVHSFSSSRKRHRTHEKSPLANTPRSTTNETSETVATHTELFPPRKPQIGTEFQACIPRCGDATVDTTSSTCEQNLAWTESSTDAGDDWSATERAAFRDAILAVGRTFDAIAKRVRTRSRGACVSYYYRHFKKNSNAYRRFKASMLRARAKEEEEEENELKLSSSTTPRKDPPRKKTKSTSPREADTPQKTESARKHAKSRAPTSSHVVTKSLRPRETVVSDSDRPKWLPKNWICTQIPRHVASSVGQKMDIYYYEISTWKRCRSRPEVERAVATKESKPPPRSRRRRLDRRTLTRGPHSIGAIRRRAGIYSDREVEVTANERPDWLPDNWICTKVARQGSGKAYNQSKFDYYYYHTISWRRCRSRPEVERTVAMLKSSESPSIGDAGVVRSAVASGGGKKRTNSTSSRRAFGDREVEVQKDERPAWLPAHWICTKVARQGQESKVDYYYYHTISWRRCRSKREVIESLGSSDSHNVKKKKNPSVALVRHGNDRGRADRRRARVLGDREVEVSKDERPRWLPSSWICTKVPREGHDSKFDYYYYDPIDWNRCRSKREVLGRRRAYSPTNVPGIGKGPEVKALMTTLGVSQSKVARECGISSLFPLNQWLNGRCLHMPSVKLAAAAAMAWYRARRDEESS